MTELDQLLAQGEHASLEFKSEDVRSESLARELVSFSNTLGGVVLIGVDDHGAIVGVSDRAAMEQRIVNVARHHVVPAIDLDVAWLRREDKDVCQVRVDKGTAKPYQTLDGKFLIRVGSTNRQATKEELSRLFQAAGLIHFDRRIQLFLFRDRLEVRSPGRLPNTLNLRKIRYGNSAPRNLLLLKYLDNMRYIDGLGRGIPSMIQALGERVGFAEIGEIFTVTIWLSAQRSRG